MKTMSAIEDRLTEINRVDNLTWSAAVVLSDEASELDDLRRILSAKPTGGALHPARVGNSRQNSFTSTVSPCSTTSVRAGISM